MTFTTERQCLAYSHANFSCNNAVDGSSVLKLLKELFKGTYQGIANEEKSRFIQYQNKSPPFPQKEDTFAEQSNHERSI